MRNSITVNVPGHGEYVVRSLLGNGDNNTKLGKSDKAEKGFLTVGLSLSPANESGYQTCASSSKGCRKACLYTSGHARIFKTVNLARRAKTIAFFEQREAFRDMLITELVQNAAKAAKQGKRLACRLNVVSDIQWEKVFPELFSEFTSVQFYDYTKHYHRIAFANGNFPANYHLTFSRSENNETLCKSILLIGGNVAVVFSKKELPKEWNGFPVVNGDETDLRFLDPAGSVIGLYAKGDAKRDESGFVVRVPLMVIN